MPPDQNPTENNPAPDSSPTTASDPSNMSPEAPEAPGDGFTHESTNTPLDTTNTEISKAENELKTEKPENMDSSASEPSAEAEAKADSQTAQTPVNEPLAKPSLARELLIKALNAIQFRKRKKLDKVMSLFLKQSKITNDEVEKFLHVSDATATRYLSQLEQEGKIKQVGKTGKGVSYSRI